MLRFRRWLLPALLLASVVTAAPVPESSGSSVGPITDYLRLRAALADAPAPLATKVTARGDRLEVTAVVQEYVTEMRLQKVQVTKVVPVQREVTRTVVREGKEVTEKVVVTENVTQVIEVPQQYAVTVPRSVTQTMQMPAKECRYYTVTREGKLEALELAKATARLAEPAAVLMGTSATIDPRHLEMVKPGTLYLILPAQRTVGMELPPPEGGPLLPPDR